MGMPEVVKSMHPRIAWGITGAGHFLEPCLNILLELDQVDIFISNAAKEVLANYGLLKRLEQSGRRLFWDTGFSSGPVTKLYRGYYQAAVIAPVTSNTIAKMVNGISDNLVTNLFAHAGKCQIPTLLLPCDIKPEMNSLTPLGESVQVHVRKVDLDNIDCLASWTGVEVARDPEDLKLQLRTFSHNRKYEL